MEHVCLNNLLLKPLKQHIKSLKQMDLKGLVEVFQGRDDDLVKVGLHYVK